MGKIAITSDCTCDLSEKILEEYDIKLIYFYMDTDSGCFKDFYEITARNVLEYVENGGKKIVSLPPKVEEIIEFYENILKEYDEIIHIAISSSLSEAYNYATMAAQKFAGKVHVIDGKHLSTGTGHLLIRAAELAKQEKEAKEIVEEINVLTNKVSTTFILDKLDSFYRTGRVNKFVYIFCDLFRIHPVVAMKKGKMCLNGVRIGDYEKSAMRYARKEFRNASKISKRRIFITHPACKLSLITQIKQMADKYDFVKIHVTRASATITGNCGSNTVGVIFVRE